MLVMNQMVSIVMVYFNIWLVLKEITENMMMVQIKNVSTCECELIY